MRRANLILVKLLSLDDDDRAWDEKLEDLTGVDDEEDEPKRQRRKKKTSSECSSTDGGSDYPLDVWYLISEYLDPEDIGLFAAICRTSQAVVNSAQFWFSLYKRYKKLNTEAEVPKNFLSGISCKILPVI